MRKFLITLLFLTGCPKPKPVLDDLGTLPPWQLTDQDGKPFGSEQLKGQPWVANFLFTSCPSSCPPLARATQDLQERVRPWMRKNPQKYPRIVSISVDPETDTPEVLRQWGKTYQQDPQIWSLVTGDYATMEKLVVQGFMQPIIRKDRVPGQPVPPQPTPIDTAHSLRFVLVDAHGHLRGLYATDETGKLDQALQELTENP